MWTERLIITDVTRMHENRVCVAGINMQGESIRPVLPRGALTVDHLYRNEELLIRPGYLLEFQFQKKTAHPPHTEDCIYLPEKVKFLRVLDQVEMEETLAKSCSASVEEIFEGALIEGKYLKPATGKKSIGTVRVRITRLDLNAQRISFYDGANTFYPVRKITDIAFSTFSNDLLKRKQEEQAYFLYKLKKSKRLFLRVGLTRPWINPDGREGCWLQVTAVYTFPDILMRDKLILFQTRNKIGEPKASIPKIPEVKSKSNFLSEVRKKHPAAYTKWTEEDDSRLINGLGRAKLLLNSQLCLKDS